VDVDPSQLPSALDLTVYRIVQESITNVIKHATDASRIEVAVTVTGRELTVDVLDDGRSRGERPPGYGLAGMAERVALHGGALECGAAPGAGWRVSARLPLPSSPNGPAA
jgi:signal transduction histidine kinase